MSESLSIEIPEDDGAVAVSYFDVGTSDLVLLCLHGIQGSKRSFEPMMESEVGRAVRIVAPDLPGFGDSGSAKNQSYTLDDHASRLIAFLGVLGLRRVGIVGHSLGGMLGTILLQMIPDRIACLVNLEGNLRGPDCGETRRVAAMSFGTFLSERLVQLRETDDPYLRYGMARVRPEAFYETAVSVVEWSESERLVDTLAETEVPVLFARAEHGSFFSEPKGPEIRNVIVPDANHFTMSRSPALFVAVREFLGEVKS